MSEIAGLKTGKEICQAMGLDPDLVAKITLTFAVGSVATVEVLTYIGQDRVDPLAKVLKRYKLVELPQ